MPAHDVTVFLFDVGAVVGLIGPCTGEVNIFVTYPGDDGVVDKLPGVVRLGPWRSKSSQGGTPTDDRSVSMKPGSCSCSSPALRTVIELRSSGPAFVAESPLGLSASLVGLRSRSIVAPGELHQLHSDSRCQPLGVEFTKRFKLG